MNIREFIWPMLEERSECESREIEQKEANDLARIQDSDWNTEIDIALQEAHRIDSEEENRIKTAESKAANLLLFVGALVPLLIFLESTAWEEGLVGIQLGIARTILIFSVAYLGMASLWASRTFNVGNYHRVYSNKLVDIWENKGEIKRNLVSEVLSSTRRNQEAVNSKVTALKMTHAFLLRAIFALAALVLVRVLFEAWNVFGHEIIRTLKGWIC